MEITKIVQIFEYAVLLVPVLLAALGILMFFGRENETTPRVADLIKKVFSRKTLAIILVGVLTVSFIGISFAQSKLAGNIKISFNFAESSRGLNPNETRFNTYDIIEDEVLEKAIELGNLGDMSIPELRSSLSVVPVETGSTISAEHYYVSSEYALVYEANGKTMKRRADKILYSVASAYYEIFKERYCRKTDVLELDFTAIDDMDYLDKIDVFDKYVADVSEYLLMCNGESKTYANADGETFATLAAKVKNLGNVELEKVKSYILTKGLSKDSKQQISKLEYENLIKDINYEKNTASYKINLEAIDMYNRDMATVVLVPTRDETGEFYMGRTKLGVDNFANTAHQASDRASLSESAISSNNYATARITSSQATEADYTAADGMIESLKTNLGNFATKARTMVEEYDESSKGAFVSFGTANLDWFDKGFVIKTIVFVIFFAVCTVMFILGMPEKVKKVKKEKTKKTKEVEEPEKIEE